MVQAHVALSVTLNLKCYFSVLPRQESSAVYFVFIIIRRWTPFCTFAKISLVTADLLHCSHSSYHLSVEFSSSSIFRVVLGILLKLTGISLSLAASLGMWSASLFPGLAAWA